VTTEKQQYHFWFSPSMLHSKLSPNRPRYLRAGGTPERVYRNYCLINGIEHEYSVSSQKPEHGCERITDLQYLGRGTYSRHIPI